MILRQQNWLGQQRVDVPHLRALESSAAEDLDLLAGQIIAGLKPMVVQGFSVGAFTPGTAATSLQISVAGGVLAHPTASEVGTIFRTASSRTTETLSTTNTHVSGGFTAGATNYVGVDLRRTADATTEDLVQFIDADTKLENPKDIPLGRTLDYLLTISTQSFDAQVGVAPIAIVVTNASNGVVSVTDARNMMFRLGSGGTAPSAVHTYAWTGLRTGVDDNTSFTHADKSIPSFKDWLDAAMTRIWELGGGEHWYSPTADRNVKLMRTGLPMGSGDWFTWVPGTNTLTWQGLRMVFANSTATYNTVADNLAGVVLNDGQCIYVDVQRDTDAAALTAAVGTLATLNTPTTPGSRFVLAWRSGTTVYARDSAFAVGVTVPPATASGLGTVQLTYAAGLSATPKVAPQDANGMISNIATGGGQSGFFGTGASGGNGITGQGGAGGGFGLKGVGGAYIGVGSGAGIYAAGDAGGGSGGIFHGSGVGNGVDAYGGLTTGVGVNAIGGAQGSAVVSHEYQATDGGTAWNSVPQILAFDAAGHRRPAIDHNGLPMFSGTSHFFEDWTTQNQIAASITTRWVNSFAGAATLTFMDPGYPLPAPSIEFTVPASTGSASVTTNSKIFYPSPDAVLALEFWVHSAVNDAQWFGEFGLTDGTAPLNRDGIAMFRGKNGGTSTNWWSFSNNTAGSGGQYDTAILPSSATGWDRIRIEYHGVNTPIGVAVATGLNTNPSIAANTAKARFFVNGVLVNVMQVYATHPMVLYFKAYNTSASGYFMQVGPVKMAWTILLNSDNV